MSIKKIAQLKKHLQNLEKGKVAMMGLIDKEEEAWFLQAYLHSYDKKRGGVTGADFKEAGKTRFVPVKPHRGPRRELDHRFQIIKKQKKDLLRLDKAIQATQLLIDALMTSSEIAPSEKKPPIPKTLPSSKAPTSSRKPYLRFLSSEGDEIWVGRSAKENEILTFQLAKGDDLWLHISGKKGPHLIIPKRKDKALSPKTLTDAFQLVLHYSGKLLSGEVIVTERRHVHKKRGDEPGRVTLSSMKNHFVKKEALLLDELLKSRFTPLP